VEPLMLSFTIVAACSRDAPLLLQCLILQYFSHCWMLSRCN